MTTRPAGGGERPSVFRKLKDLLARKIWLARGLILLPVLAAGIALFPPSFGEGSLRIDVGERAPRTVIADFEFPIMKEPEALETERDLAATRSPIALVRDDSVSARVFHDLGAFRSMIHRLRGGARQKAAAVSDIDLSQELLVWLMLTKDPAPLLDQAESLLQETLAEGLVAEDVEVLLLGGGEVRVEDSTGRRLLPAAIVRTPARLREAARNRALARQMEPAPFQELVDRIARPNLRYDPAETAEIREAARDAVDPVESRVLRGERIVEARERITPEIKRRLKAYDQWRDRRELGTLWARAAGWLGRLILLLVAVGAFAVYLKFLRVDLYESLTDLALLSLTASIVLGLSSLFLHVLGLPALMAPVAAAAILVSMLFDERLALVVALGLTGLVGLIAETGAPVMAVLGVGGVLAVFCVRGLRHQRQFYRLILFVPAAHLVTLLGLALAQGQPLHELLRDAIAAATNPILAAGLAVFVIPLAEHLFRKCSDITLLELSDLNRPLLRRLMVEAPGTYHHSLMVGTLAETAARVCGGNPLLSRVIGYYHDIGKVTKPDYFMENIAAGRKNPHDRLSPSMSRLILESHVREGASLALRERLPQVVVEGIRRHHGTSLMVFFWHKARRQDAQAREEEYRYPGPRPNSREAALVLLADQIDAASRALEDPTPSRIKGVVLKVLETRLAEGDLDDSELTLSDLARIRDAFVPILSAFFHTRTAYQALEEDEKNQTAVRDRESSTKGTAP
ncbi:MAG: HDIG domain-containing protein [Candidatus Eisenbacteria bacterium]|nr:HDIG domain-containing protein [Candidatus Eisenbacteria bacterium]